MKQTQKFDRRKFRAERVRQGYSYGRFAEALKTYEPKASKTIVWKWEHRTGAPSFPYMLAIAAILKRPMEFFLKA